MNLSVVSHLLGTGVIPPWGVSLQAQVTKSSRTLPEPTKEDSGHMVGRQLEPVACEMWSWYGCEMPSQPSWLFGFAGVV
ncbi:hypothetical protein HZ326_14479 [Fusarium oxysporum f. sp. albedinis]|nr:hypothetical protein HZ326_14479 [Fusarium oxysporum f. sp. albedinis]